MAGYDELDSEVSRKSVNGFFGDWSSCVCVSFL